MSKTSLEGIERDFSRRTLIIKEDSEVSLSVPSITLDHLIDEKDLRITRKRQCGDHIPWTREEWLALFKSEKLGKAQGNLSLVREVFLPRRHESDIKSEKRSEGYLEFAKKQREFEIKKEKINTGKNKRKLNEANSKDKNVKEIEQEHKQKRN